MLSHTLSHISTVTLVEWGRLPAWCEWKGRHVPGSPEEGNFQHPVQRSYARGNFWPESWQFSNEKDRQINVGSTLISEATLQAMMWTWKVLDVFVKLEPVFLAGSNMWWAVKSNGGQALKAVQCKNLCVLFSKLSKQEAWRSWSIGE